MHRIADIRYRKPFIVICTCGWNDSTANSSFEVERAWKLHRDEVSGKRKVVS